MPDEQVEASASPDSSEPIVVFDVDPSFPNQELVKMQDTVNNSKPFLGGWAMRPVRRIDIHVFPEDNIPKMNQAIAQLGMTGELGKRGDNRALAQMIRYLDDDTHAEIFVPFGGSRPLSYTNHGVGHELVHLLEGTQEDPNIAGEVWDLMRRRSDWTPDFFEFLKERMRRAGEKPICYEHMGLATYIKSRTLEGKTRHWLVCGRALNETVIDLLAATISFSNMEGPIAQKLSDLVGFTTLAFAYSSGQTNHLAKIFQEKTGVPFTRFTDLLDEAVEILEADSSQDRTKEAGELGKLALSFLNQAPES